MSVHALNSNVERKCSAFKMFHVASSLKLFLGFLLCITIDLMVFPLNFSFNLCILILDYFNWTDLKSPGIVLLTCHTFRHTVLQRWVGIFFSHFLNMVRKYGTFLWFSFNFFLMSCVDLLNDMLVVDAYNCISIYLFFNVTL